MEFIAICLILSLGICYMIFLKVVSSKVEKIESVLKKLVTERSNTIPGIFEATEPYLTMHGEVFNGIIKLRKQEFYQLESNGEITHLLKTKDLISHEFKFIFSASQKHPQLLKDARFIHMQNLIRKRDSAISQHLDIYKTSVLQLNHYISLKKYSIVGLIIPFAKKIPVH